jgi:hypothetical protein
MTSLHLNARPLLMENGWHLMPVLITSIKALQINFLIIQKFRLMSVKKNVLMTHCALPLRLAQYLMIVGVTKGARPLLMMDFIQHMLKLVKELHNLQKNKW